MGGGAGTRLFPLTSTRPKQAVWFINIYDFLLRFHLITINSMSGNENFSINLDQIINYTQD